MEGGALGYQNIICKCLYLWFLHIFFNAYSFNICHVLIFELDFISSYVHRDNSELFG